jgi:hypothetical protein
MFCVSALTGLDDLLLTLNSLRTKSEEASLSDFTVLKKESIALNLRFANWQSSLIPEFNPTIIGHIHDSSQSQSQSPSQSASEISPGYWPGRVETYFELYVAGVWNIFRTARLLLLALIIKLSDSEDKGDVGEYRNTANRIVEDILASVPYHLVDNLQVFLHDSESESDTRDEITYSSSGRVLGGLLLMHPLYVSSQCLFLDKRVREYMRGCLSWIGEHMGIGQAAVLAKVRW